MGRSGDVGGGNADSGDVDGVDSCDGVDIGNDGRNCGKLLGGSDCQKLPLEKLQNFFKN